MLQGENMKIKSEWIWVNSNNKNIQALVFPKLNRETIKDLFCDWQSLNRKFKSHGNRGINLHEVISENAITLCYPDLRRIDKLKKERCSFDCLNIKTGSRIQVKATSITKDLTSFGPNSQWDELFFLDFSDGKNFKVYKIEDDWIYNYYVNETQTVKDQQMQGKRPRFSIIDKIIKPKNLIPTHIYNLVD